MRSLLFLVVLSSLLTGCETNLIDNPSFDRWCGEQLCDWQTTAGHIERVGSWHEHDYAVSFVDQGTTITQVSSGLLAGSCMRFDMIADVDAEAALTLLIDYQDDGSIDERQRVAAVHWANASVVFRAPRSSSKIRYTFWKEGEGRAVLAQVWAEDSSDCSRISDEP